MPKPTTPAMQTTPEPEETNLTQPLPETLVQRPTPTQPMPTRGGSYRRDPATGRLIKQ